MNESEHSVRNIFAAALEISDAEQRAAYLNRACGANADLRCEVEELLQAEADAGKFLPDQPVAIASRFALRELADAAEFSSLPSAPISEKPGDRIGHYKLLQQIGEGGCGVVYLAEQEEPLRRRIALKVIKLGMDTKQVIARFEAERQALAMMDHPNIARVFDAGATATGRPYFVMELVRGVKITEYCDEHKLSTRERLDLFIQVCQAVQHAHQKGIIHRDLKPSNILVTIADGVRVPKVIDFGVAKATGQQRLTDKTLFTAFEQFIGTPAYMSPEQAIMTSLDIDTRSDIYSLGVLLYELLTGTTPFDSKELLASGLDEIRRTIREQEPKRPSTRLTQALVAADVGRLTSESEKPNRKSDEDGASLRRLLQEVRGDLDCIVMKCLEKDRARRYETANGLARDIERHLNNEPVVARPPSRLYEFQKTVRRHKFGFAATAAVIVALLLGFLGVTWALRLAMANQKNAETAAARSAQETRLMKDMLKGVGPAVALGRDTKLLREILDQTAQRLKTDLTNQPTVEADLRETLGIVYRDLADYTNAVAMLQESLVLRTNCYGRTNAAVASSLHNLAEVFRLQWRNAEAAKAFREALAIRTNLNKPLDVAASMYGLAETLRRGNSTRDEAEALHLEALAIRRKMLGEHQDVAKSLTGLGIALRDTGVLSEISKAETNMLEAVAILKGLRLDLRLDLAYTLFNLGGTLVRMPGRLADAERVLREALAIQKIIYGDHPETAQTLSFLGDTLLSERRLPGAEEMYRESLEMRNRVHSPDRKIRVDLSRVLRLLGKSAEAETLQREALALYRQRAENERFDNSGYFLWRSAIALQGYATPAEIEELYNEAVILREKLFASELPGATGVQTNLAESVTMPGKKVVATADAAMGFRYLGLVFWRLDRLAEAESMLREALPLLRRTEGEGVTTGRTLNDLGNIVMNFGKYEEAESRHRDALALRRKLYGNWNLEVAESLANLTAALLAQNKFDEAGQKASECLAIRKQEMGDHWLRFCTQTLVGRALLGQKHYDEAERELRDGYVAMKQREDTVVFDEIWGFTNALQRAMRDLERLYEATGKPEQAAEWKAKLEAFNKTPR